MANFQAVDEYLEDWINLPIGGKTYRVNSPDAKTGLLVSRLMSVAVDLAAGHEVEEDARMQLILDDKDELDMMTRVLGKETLDAMIEDKVPWPMVQHALQTTMIWVAQGLPSAEAFWVSVMPGKGPGQKPPQDRKKKATTRKARQG